jgi:hypothetical protein
MPGGFGGPLGGVNKSRLAALVTKLDDLTSKPLELTLSEDQKKKVREQIKDLDQKEELSDEEAKKRLDALQEVVTPEQRKTLEAAGFRFAPQRGGGPPANLPNPFQAGDDSKHLKELKDRLGSGKAG